MTTDMAASKSAQNPPYVERSVDLPALLQKRSHFLFGPRQTGKSSLIHHTLEGVRHAAPLGLYQVETATNQHHCDALGYGASAAQLRSASRTTRRSAAGLTGFVSVAATPRRSVTSVFTLSPRPETITTGIPAVAGASRSWARNSIPGMQPAGMPRSSRTSAGRSRAIAASPSSQVPASVTTKTAAPRGGGKTGRPPP